MYCSIPVLVDKNIVALESWVFRKVGVGGLESGGTQGLEARRVAER